MKIFDRIIQFGSFGIGFKLFGLKSIDPPFSQKVDTSQPSHHSMPKIEGWNHQIQVWQWRLSNVLAEKTHNQYRD